MNTNLVLEACHGTLFPLPHLVIDVSQGFCEHSLESAHGDPPHVSHLQRGLQCRSVPAIVIAAISVIAKLRTLSYSLENHGISKSPPEPLCSCSQLKIFAEQQRLWCRSVPAIVMASINVIAKLRPLSYCPGNTMECRSVRPTPCADTSKSRLSRKTI